MSAMKIKAVKLDVDLHRELKARAAAKGVGIKEFVDEILRKWLERRK